MKNLVIRPAVNSDIPAVTEIAALCWAPIYEGFTAILGEELFALAYPDAIHAKQQAVAAAVQSGKVFAAEADGVVCGFASYLINGSMGIIGNNAVHPDYKGQGIAPLLYARLFEEFKSHGCTVARVHTGLDENHAPARRAYEKMGFEAGLPGINYYKELSDERTLPWISM